MMSNAGQCPSNDEGRRAAKLFALLKCIRGVNVFRPYADTNQACRDTAQERETPKRPHEKRHF